MNLKQLPPWLRVAIASAGGPGLFLVAFLDSSVLTFPVLNDLLVMHLSLQKPAWMPYYVFMATVGSVAGSLLLYFLAHKGGEVMFRKHAGERADRIRGWTERNGVLSVLIPAMLPPPAPFKLFVIAAGVFQVPVATFTLTLLVARSFRFLAMGLLAVRYGDAASRYLLENKLEFSLIAMGVLLASYLVTRLVFRGKHPA